jgi:LmbE family N-acetylglucosaminyl deacetylase
MIEPLKLMCIVAHPDDETLGAGGMLARYSAEGVETSLVCATRGERGWAGSPQDHPGLDAVGQPREQELIQAVRMLGLHQMYLLDYGDGDLDQIDPGEIVPKIASIIRKVRPQVVVTFDPKGAYGHPDHIAICQYTHSALILSADSCAPLDGNPHQVLKLYYMVETPELLELYRTLFGSASLQVDGIERQPAAWENWAVTTRVDTHAFRDVVWQAATCYHSKFSADDALRSALACSTLWDSQTFFRAMSLVNSGRAVEDDLFAGIRTRATFYDYAVVRPPCEPRYQREPG